MTDRDRLAIFLRTLHPTDEGFCELRALPSKTRIFVPVNDVDAVATFLARHTAENCYVGVASRRAPTNGTLANCLDLHVLFVDLDFKQVEAVAARERLARFPLPPSLMVQSGAGLHVYWQLKEPLALPADAAHAKSLLIRLAVHFGADHASAEPAHVLRIPGSLNHKYATPQPVSTLELTWLM